jgi:replication factor C subunit 2/4
VIWLWYYQVCDQPHPLVAQQIIKHCIAGNIDDAYVGLKQLHDLGYSATDIITTLFRVVKNYEMVEFLKLEFIRVSLVIQSLWYITAFLVLMSGE